jgi:hypothetical protein
MYVCVRRSEGEDAGATSPDSSDDDNFLLGIRRQCTQGFFPAVFEDQLNRLAEIGETFLACDTLPISAGDLSAIGDKPRAVLFHGRSELIAHPNSLTPCAPRGQTQGLLDFGRKIEPMEHGAG